MISSLILGATIKAVAVTKAEVVAMRTGDVLLKPLVMVLIDLTRRNIDARILSFVLSFMVSFLSIFKPNDLPMECNTLHYKVKSYIESLFEFQLEYLDLKPGIQLLRQSPGHMDLYRHSNAIHKVYLL